MLAVIDYGGGNLGSLVAALERRGAEFTVTDDAGLVTKADAAIFPGDGAFGATMDALRSRKLDRAILDLIERGKPFLGICVGMQILFERSTEFGGAEGLGALKGEVTRFENAPRVPHMGWNNLEIIDPAHSFVVGLGANEYAYFLHSYIAPVSPVTLAVTAYGDRFSSIVASGNIMGTQFHPEKSQKTGAKLLDNFLNHLH